jgi:peptidoglycan/xylan/chitin deacetylase (PgdA/CDA1 family)
MRQFVDGQVLCWHLVGAGVGGPVDLDVAAFDAQLDTLLELRCVRPLVEVATSGRGIALTFDDAFANFHEVVWPRLRARGLPATLFVPTGFVDGVIGSPLSTAPGLTPCRWDTLADMAAQGLDLGSHTQSHRDVRVLVDAELEQEIAGAKAAIATRTGQVPRAFCYPQAKWNARAEHVARRHHDVIVTGGGGRVDGRRPWRTPRTSIVRGGPPFAFFLRLPFHPRERLGDWLRQRR